MAVDLDGYLDRVLLAMRGVPSGPSERARALHSYPPICHRSTATCGTNGDTSTISVITAPPGRGPGSSHRRLSSFIVPLLAVLKRSRLDVVHDSLGGLLRQAACGTRGGAAQPAAPCHSLRRKL